MRCPHPGSAAATFPTWRPSSGALPRAASSAGRTTRDLAPKVILDAGPRLLGVKACCEGCPRTALQPQPLPPLCGWGASQCDPPGTRVPLGAVTNGTITVCCSALFLTPTGTNTEKEPSRRRHLPGRRTPLGRSRCPPEAWQALRTHSSSPCPSRAICKCPSQLFYCRIFDAQFFALVCYE